MSTLTQDNIRRHHDQTEAYNRHDAEALANTYRPDGVLIDHALGQTLTGPPQIRLYFESLFDGFSDDAFEEVEIIGAGDWTVGRFVGGGSHDGPWGGLEPTQRRTEAHICSVVRWQDGKVAEDHVYYDVYSLLAQLGQVPPLDANE